MKIEFEELSISEIEVFNEQIIKALEELEGDQFVLDFYNVDRIELSVIQLLLSLKKYCDDSNINLVFENINANHLLESLKIYNLEKLFGVES